MGGLIDLVDVRLVFTKDFILRLWKFIFDLIEVLGEDDCFKQLIMGLALILVVKVLFMKVLLCLLLNDIGIKKLATIWSLLWIYT